MVDEAIFIGYRRDDTADVAGRIYDVIAQRFGKRRVFKDVDNIGPGVDFGDYIRAVLPSCRVALVLIGPQWLNSKDKTGKRRLDDDHDWVRVELETALSTPGLQIVPVLVNGAPMPRVEQLPESLRPLCALNAAFVRRDPDFHKDMDKLMLALEAGSQNGSLLELPKPVAGGSTAAWRMIEGSLDLDDYVAFQAHFPGTPEIILAGRHRRQLEAWLRIDKNDPDAVEVFIQSQVFEALKLLAHNHLQSIWRDRQAAREKLATPRAIVGEWGGVVRYPSYIVSTRWAISADGSYRAFGDEFGVEYSGSWTLDGLEFVFERGDGTTYRGQVQGDHGEYLRGTGAAVSGSPLAFELRKA